MRILIIEDDLKTASYLKRALSEQGHVLDTAQSATDGLYLISECNYDLLIVDRMLPDSSGVELIKRLRQQSFRAPILMLTAMGTIDDKVSGLEAGADDYLVKPFALAELSARINSLARRPISIKAEDKIIFSDLEIDPIRRTVKRAGSIIELHPTEFRLLEYLARRPGQIVTRTMLLEGVWDFHFDPKTSIVETHISRLRTKIDKPFDKELIHTVRGAGYMLIDEDQR